MDYAELQRKTDDQLADELLSLKKEQFNLRFQSATGQSQSPTRARAVRRSIARIMTLQNARRRASASA